MLTHISYFFFFGGGEKEKKYGFLEVNGLAENWFGKEKSNQVVSVGYFIECYLITEVVVVYCFFFGIFFFPLYN